MDQPERTREVHIHVNEKPVILGTHEATGLVIKETAIAQHVPIQPDFVLSEELEDTAARWSAMRTRST